MKHTKWLAAILIIAAASLVFSACSNQPEAAETTGE